MQKYTAIIKPRSSEEKVRQDTPEFFTIFLKSREADKLANKRVLELLAEHLSLPLDDFRVIAGHTARIKVIQVGQE